MTTKTLGQVLYEAEVAAYAMYVTAKPWVELSEAQKQEYEQAAQAVAAVVREQCGQEARAHYRLMCAAAEMRPMHISESDASPAIRSMK